MSWLSQNRILIILLFLGCVYFFSAKGLVEISDTDYSIRTAKALIEEQTFLIEPPDPAVVASSPKVVDGKIYSKYGVGLAILFLPIVLLAKLVAILPTIQEGQMTGFLISFYNIPFALGALFFLHRICRHLGASKDSANLVVLGLGLGTFFWKYTTSDYSEITQLFFLLGTIFYLFRSENGDMTKASAMFSGLILMKLVNVLIWAPLGVYLLLRHGFGKPGFIRVFHFASVVFFTGILLLCYNHIRYGSPFITGYEGGGPSFSLDNMKRDFFDYIFSTQRGLFTFNPILLVALPFWALFLKQHKNEAICLLLVISLWFLLMASWVSYQGGWAWGNRLLVFTIPILLLPIAIYPLKAKWQKVLLIGVFGLSFYIQIVSVFQHTHEYFVILRDMEQDEELVGHMGAMPAQLPANIILFHQKLGGNSGEYFYSTFLGSNTPPFLASNKISTLEYQSYQGLHTWPFHLASFLGQPTFCCLLLGILPCLAFLLFQFYKFTWHSNSEL